MPFKSEKQRRFMWAEHPEIARKWADKYDTPKDLPMYAKKKQTKKSEESINRHRINSSILDSDMQENTKKADSKQEKVTIPHSEEPVYAGEEREKGKLQGHFDDKPEVNDSKPENSLSSLLHKMSVVLSPRLAKALEQRNSQKAGRQPAYQPKVQGLKPFYAQQPTVAPPMAMQQAQVQQPQQNVTYPSRPTNAVGGGNNPAANPINSFGALSMSGNLNGNAAFGAKNSPDSLKTSSVLKWSAADTPCSCGCGDTVATCKCSKDCSCRKPGGSCYKAEKKAAQPNSFMGGVTGWTKRSAKKPGLWANIHAKRKRGEKPAKPADKDYPDSKSWNKTVKSSLAAAIKSAAIKLSKSPAWQRSEGKNSEGGLNAKGRASYNKSTGGNLKAPVTQKNPKGKAKSRRASFCARMGGMKKKLTGEKTKNDPDSRINKALRKWNC